jgi:predicted nucleotidyltransferase
MQYGALVQKALAHKKVQREHLRQSVLDRVFEALEQLAGQVHFDEAFVFGSAATPYMFTDSSDVDIGFWNLKDEQYFFTMASLSRAIERDVDVIQLETAADSLRTRILKEGIKWTPGNSLS